MMGVNMKKLMVAMAATASLLLYTEAAAGAYGYNNDVVDALRLRLHPVVLVPGTAGSQLEARLTGEYKATSSVCNQYFPANKDGEGWFRLWFDSMILLRPFTNCFADRMMLYYDREVDDYHNAPGVETRVSQFGSTRSLLYLNPDLKQVTEYMAPLVKSLEKLGYIDGETLFGAPYDFRYGLAAKGHPSRVGSRFLDDLKSLIENATASNNGKRVILLSHSLGSLYTLQLLNRNTLSWRKKHIKHFIALASPWGGTVEELLTYASGFNLGMPIDPLLLRGEERTFESNLWMMPSPTTFGGEKTLVITSNSNYSAFDIPRFLDDIGFPQGIGPYESRILPLVVNKLTPPRVPVTCLVGTGVDTLETLIYGEKGFDEQPKILYGDGDGTVNMVSLLSLEKQWADYKNQTLKVVKLQGVSHEDIIKDYKALDKIVEEINSINSDIQLVSAA